MSCVASFEQLLTTSHLALWLAAASSDAPSGTSTRITCTLGPMFASICLQVARLGGQVGRIVSEIDGIFLFKFSQMPPMPPFTYGCDPGLSHLSYRSPGASQVRVAYPSREVTMHSSEEHEDEAERHADVHRWV